MKFDDPTVGTNLQIPSKNDAIAIEPISTEYLCQGYSIKCINFPLALAFVLTIHKLQGKGKGKGAGL